MAMFDNLVKLTDDYKARYCGNNHYQVVRMSSPEYSFILEEKDNIWISCAPVVDECAGIIDLAAKGIAIAEYMKELKAVANLFFQWFNHQSIKVENIEVGGKSVCIQKGLKLTEEDRMRCFIEPLEKYRLNAAPANSEN